MTEGISDRVHYEKDLTRQYEWVHSAVRKKTWKWRLNKHSVKRLSFCHVYLIILRIKASALPLSLTQRLATIILDEHQPKTSTDCTESFCTTSNLLIMAVPHYFCWLQPQTNGNIFFIVEKMDGQHLGCEMAVASHWTSRWFSILKMGGDMRM